MGANNRPTQAGYVMNEPVLQKKAKRITVQRQGDASLIVQSKQNVEYTIPQNIQNRQKVRQCINKYNDKIQLEMKKQYVQDFFNMRQKLLKNMESVCKADYSLVQAKSKQPQPNKQFKQCMTSVQSLITEEDDRMQQEFGVKLFLLADKCLIKEERLQSKDKSTTQIDRCVDKLVKYRNLNMEMHILKLQLAREML